MKCLLDIQELKKDDKQRKIRALRNLLHIFGYSIHLDVKTLYDSTSVENLLCPDLTTKIHEYLAKIQEIVKICGSTELMEESKLLEKMLLCLESRISLIRYASCMEKLLDRFLVIVGNFPPKDRQRKLQETELKLE